MNIFLRIYDCFSHHRPLLWTLLAGMVVILAILCLRLRFSEDITDFLPLDKQHKEAVARYRDITQANRIMVIFDSGAQSEGTDSLLDAVDAFESGYYTSGLTHPLTTRIDMQPYMDAVRFVYANIPYFLTDEDYQRIDSLLAQHDYIAAQMANNRALLQLPLSSFISTRILYDPLNLFEPVLADLRQFQPGASAFEMLDGYMLTKDHRMAFAYLDSPYGSSETRRNALLVDSLRQVIANTCTDIDIRLMGAPVIAVNNARQIKHDTILTLGIALFIITALLLYSARRKAAANLSFRHILLILATVGFGLLFGTAVLATIHPDVSLIVLGIGTILIGIAVNYPLHIVVHRRYTDSMRTNLQEELPPLVIGNITTIAAFLTLLPLQATALRDLGIFAAAMLVGTIVFSVIFLPHFRILEHKQAPIPPAVLPVVTHRRKPIMYAFILVITILCAVFAPRLEFDDNLSNINYMTAEQREDMTYLTSLVTTSDGTHTLYRICPDSLWNNLSEAQNTALRFLPNPVEQTKHIERWNTFAAAHPALSHDICQAANAYGFRPTAFDHSPYVCPHAIEIQPSLAFFLPLTSTILQNHYRNRYFIQPVSLAATEQYTPQPGDDLCQIIDIQTTNRKVTAALSDNFNYIGTACSLIVFIFLWLSFRGHFAGQSWHNRLIKSLWLTIIAFLPMMVSWIWILGAMHLFGLQFNIVNIILATFIFGQGDDYTIFIVEGLLYEHRTGRSILPQYRREITLSALTMLIGIGVLILAKHPAMFSLGAVTLIGMTAVVVMAMSLPPLLFRASVWIRSRTRNRAWR